MAITQARRDSVVRQVARFFSTVFNPFVTALGLFVVISHESARDTPNFWRLCSLSISFTSILPMLFVVWLYTSGRISDLDMSVRTERERVFGFFVLSYVAGTVVLALLHAPMLLVAAMGGYAAAALTMQIITKFWKISSQSIT